jgi:hypothetical protein
MQALRGRLQGHGSMMNGNYGWMSGYGGPWGSALMVVVVAGVVAWIAMRGRK